MSARSKGIILVCVVVSLGVMVFDLIRDLAGFGHPLLDAAYRGDVRALDRLLGEGTDVNTVGPYRHTALILAAYNPDTKTVDFVLRHGANVNAKDDTGMTPLHCAAYRGHVAVARLLLAKGADVALTNDYGFNPLHEAAMAGPSSMVKLLVQAGAPTDRADSDGWYPLHRLLQAEWFAKCTSKERLDLVRLLLDHGADPLATNPGGWRKERIGDSLRSGPRHIDRAKGDSPIEIATSMVWPDLVEVLRKAKPAESTRPSPPAR